MLVRAARPAVLVQHRHGPRESMRADLPGLRKGWIGTRPPIEVSRPARSEARECVQTYRERARQPEFEAATHRHDAPMIFFKVDDRAAERGVTKCLWATWGRGGKGCQVRARLPVG